MKVNSYPEQKKEEQNYNVTRAVNHGSDHNYYVTNQIWKNTSVKNLMWS